MNHLPAYAKINIGLRILYKREDGYHELETVFHRINVFDVLSFETDNKLLFSSSDATLPAGESNLCMKAAFLLQERFGVKQGAKIKLEKNIPIGAGLGGGSSDAATTLLGLNQLWNLELTVDELAPLAISLGSDVPYFLKEGSAHATGRGEQLSYFRLDVPYWIVLVYPNIHVSTVWAYRQFNIKEAKTKSNLFETITQKMGTISELHRVIQNDFEDVVFPEYSVIAEVKKRLLEFGSVFSQMSGSGSSVYGFFDNEAAAKNAIDIMGKEFRLFLTPPNFQATT